MARPRVDTSYRLRYNAREVSGDKPRTLDEQQFGSEVMRHLDHLYRVAFYLTKNEQDAQDCVQETCARALSAKDQFRSGSNLKAWLTRILYNFFYDAYTRGKRWVASEDLTDATDPKKSFLDTLPADYPGPEARVLEFELASLVSEALKKVPEEFRAPIVLVDMGDFSYQEAAEILDCPIGTVRSRLSRGRRLLQNLLSTYLTKRANR